MPAAGDFRVWSRYNGSVPKIDAVGGMVTAKNASIYDANTNSGTETIDGTSLNHMKCTSASGCTLTAGTDSLDERTLSTGDHLKLDPVRWHY